MGAVFSPSTEKQCLFCIGSDHLLCLHIRKIFKQCLHIKVHKEAKEGEEELPDMNQGRKCACM